MRKVISIRATAKQLKARTPRLCFFKCMNTQLNKISDSLFIFPLHLMLLKSICIHFVIFHTTFPMQLGQGTTPMHLIMSPLFAQASFSLCLWLTPCNTAKIASVFSHLRVFAPKERDKHCTMTDFFRGTSYLYRQNLKAIYQWQSFN